MQALKAAKEYFEEAGFKSPSALKSPPNDYYETQYSISEEIQAQKKVEMVE